MFILSNLYSDDKLPQSLCFKKKELKKQYSSLTCKIDSFYYALGYLLDSLPPIEYFINNINVEKNNAIKLNNDKTYSIIDPLDCVINGFNAQQARFSYKNELLIFKNNSYHKPFYDESGFFDYQKNNLIYQKTVSFGLDNELLLNTFKTYLSDKKIQYSFFYVEKPSLEKMVEIFTNYIYQKKIIVCNGIVNDFENPRVFTFKILNSNKIYKWKEASHSYVLIGYDLNKEVFIVADNFGNLKSPYNPKFFEIDFTKLYKDITLLDKKTFDKSYVLWK